MLGAKSRRRRFIYESASVFHFLHFHNDQEYGFHFTRRRVHAASGIEAMAAAAHREARGALSILLWRRIAAIGPGRLIMKIRSRLDRNKR